jgi:hypothetical protein
MTKLSPVWLVLLCLCTTFSCSNNIHKLNRQIKTENKIFRIGLNNTKDSQEVEFYSIRMDVQFQSKEDFQNLFEAQNFNYIMNDICTDFKFLNGSDTISCANNFATFNQAVQSVSFICLFPAEIKKADQLLIRKNCFLNQNLIQEL